MELALVQYIYPEWKEVWEAISDGNLTIENAHVSVIVTKTR